MSTDPHAHLKEKKLQKLRGRAAGAVITVSDRCKSGERPDKSGPLAQELLAGYGIDVDRVRVVADGIESVQNEIRAAIAEGARVVLTTGGTGITERDLTPEATAPLLEARLDAIAWQICQQGLKATPLSSLSRALVGITGRGSEGAIVANAPGSRGGVRDTISVLGPLLPHLLEQLDPVAFPLD